jgi:hypothetical protein
MATLKLLAIGAAAALVFSGVAMAEPARVSVGNGLVSVAVPENWVTVKDPDRDLKVQPDHNNDELHTVRSCEVRLAPQLWTPQMTQESMNAAFAKKTAEDYLRPESKLISFANTKMVDGVLAIDSVFQRDGILEFHARQLLVVGSRSATTVALVCNSIILEPAGPRDSAAVREFARDMAAIKVKDDAMVVAFMNSVKITPR